MVLLWKPPESMAIVVLVAETNRKSQCTGREPPVDHTPVRGIRLQKRELSGDSKISLLLQK